MFNNSIFSYTYSNSKDRAVATNQVEDQLRTGQQFNFFGAQVSKNENADHDHLDQSHSLIQTQTNNQAEDDSTMAKGMARSSNRIKKGRTFPASPIKLRQKPTFSRDLLLVKELAKLGRNWKEIAEKCNTLNNTRWKPEHLKK